MNHEEDLYGQIYQPGSIVFRQGEPGDVMYLIQSGAIEYSYMQGDTKRVLTILGKGDFFGEMALFGQERRPATTTAIQRSRLLPFEVCSYSIPNRCTYKCTQEFRTNHLTIHITKIVCNNPVLCLLYTSHIRNRQYTVR